MKTASHMRGFSLLWAGAAALILCMAVVRSAAFGGARTAPVLAPAVRSALPLRFYAIPGSRVVLNGKATLGSWSSVSTAVKASVLLPTSDTNVRRWLRVFHEMAATSVRPPPFPLSHKPKARLSLAVCSLRGSSSGMNHDMWAALKAKRHPEIKYRLGRVESSRIVRSPKTGRILLQMRVRGCLTLAGRSRKLISNLVIHPMGSDRFLVRARSLVKMRDYGVTPPSAFFGLIRGKNRVHIAFDLVLRLAGSPRQHPGRP